MRYMAGYDSHDEVYGANEEPKKRQKRFAFQSFAQRVAKVSCQYLAWFFRDDGNSGFACLYYSLIRKL